MFFSKKKKTLRDREAGLMFCWRGGNAMNRGGGTLALCLTSAIFAGGFLLLNVSAKPNIVPSRYRASVIQLSKVDDRLAWWIERHSPPIPQWSVSADEKSVKRVDRLLLDKINTTMHRGVGYQDIDIQKVTRIDGEIFSLNSDTLPPIDRHIIAEETNDNPFLTVQWGLDISVKNDLKERWPDDLVYDQWIPDSWRGSSVKFSVLVDSSGKVLVAESVDRSEDPIVKEFQNWLYAVSFKPAKKKKESAEALIGIVEFRSVSEVKSLKDEEVGR